MAKMKVGEILIEDGMISFAQTGLVSPASAPTGGHRLSDLHRLLQLAPRPVVLVATGMACLTLGLTATLVAFLASDALGGGASFALLLAAVLVGGVGLGGLCLAAMSALIRRHPLPSAAAPSDRARLEEERARRLRPLLVDQGQLATVEWLVEQTGMMPEVVVRSLAYFEARGELDEELNLDTGEWYYRLNHAPTRLAPLTLRERVERLAGSEKSSE